jgi:hypothetical protein
MLSSEYLPLLLTEPGALILKSKPVLKRGRTTITIMVITADVCVEHITCAKQPGKLI